MKPLIRTATASLLFCLVQLVFFMPAQAAPGDYLYEWGANVHFSNPHAIARDGSRNVYVTDLISDSDKVRKSVQIFDRTGKRLGKWGDYGSADGQLAYPAGISVGPDGNVYIVETQNNRVQVLTRTGTFLRKWGSPGTGNGEFDAPNAIATDTAGNVYVCDSVNHRIQVFDSTGRYLRKWGSVGSGEGELNFPGAVTVDGSGTVYVADTGNSRIQVFNSSGGFLRKWGSQGEGNGQFISPSAITLDAAGRVLVTDYVTSSVQVFDRSGAFIAKWPGVDQGNGGLSGPSGIIADTNGEVYVAGNRNSGIDIYNSAGIFLRKWWSQGFGNGELNGPIGLAVDPEENVYVADSINGRIAVFTGSGTFLRSWGRPIDEPWNFVPFGVAINSAWEIHVVNVPRSTVVVYDRYGKFLREWSAGTFFEAVDVAVAPNDYVYVASGLGIQVFDAAGSELNSWSYPLVQMVRHIAADARGNLYASDSEYARIGVFDIQGNLLRTIGEGKFTSGPGAIEVDQNGNVLVAGNDNQILVFDANGTLRATWGGTGDEPGHFDGVTGIALNKTGTKIFVSDYNNNRIQVLEGFGDQVPGGWLTRDIGSVGVAGRAGYSNGTFTLAGSGADIWGSADAFRFVYQPLTGDGQIVARVATLQNTHGYAKGGVMIRESLSANSRHAMMVLTPSYGAEFSRRSTTGGSTAVTGFSGAPPYWVKLVRQGNSFSGYVSSNGTTWSPVGTSSITMGSTVYVGLVVSSHNNSVLSSSTMTNVSLTGQVNIPTVAITAPAEGTSYNAPASIPITATATAGAGATVKQVDFFAGTTLIGTATASPYRFTWSIVAAGEYALTARVVDTLGGMVTSAPVKVSVVNTTLPSPWITSDIGNVGLAGSAGYLNGVFTVKGAGADIWGSTDAFRFVYQPLSGDGQIVARVASLQNTNGYAKVGIMFRQSLAPNSIHTFMDLTPLYGAQFIWRSSTGGSSSVSGATGVAAPYWVKLVRSGNTFTGYISPNGTTWRTVGSSTIAMGSSAYAGLAVTSHNTSALLTATMDGVRVEAGPVVLPTATITSPPSGATFSAPAAIPITATASPGSGAAVSRVDFYAGSTPIGTATSTPYSLIWSNAGAGSYSLTAVVTDTLGNKGTSTPVSVTVSALPVPWATADIGSVGLAGSASYLNGVFTLRGTGADIWGGSDAFRFVYKPMTGDGEIIARVSSLQNTHGYAKGGVMIRESLAAGSKHALMDLTPSYGAEFLRRTTTGGTTVSSKIAGITAPYWVRLVRSGNTFTGYVSSNGITWTQVGSSTISMNSTVYVGLVVSSHNNSALCSTTIDGVR